MNRINKSFVLIFFVLFIVCTILYFKLDFIYYDHIALTKRAFYNPTEKNINKYLEIINSNEFKAYLDSSLNIKVPEISDKNIHAAFSRHKKAYNAAPESLALITSSTHNKLQVEKEKDILETANDAGFIEGIKYTYPGSDGTVVFEQERFVFFHNSKYQSNLINRKILSRTEHSPQQSFVGTQKVEDAKNEINEAFMASINKISEVYPESSRYKNLEFKDINAKKGFTSIVSKSQPMINIGKVNVYQGNCDLNINLQVFYDTQNKTYTLGNTDYLFDKLCDQKFIKKDWYWLGTCTECTYYPADKWHALPETYEPEVRSIDPVPGGHQIHVNAYNELIEMHNAAKAAGLFFKVVSGYRSYWTQFNTFNYWVNYEIQQNGYDRTTAEQVAGRYSARAGFSEHQLGTTMDIQSNGCAAFVTSCGGNQQIWNWLKDNAWKYGFVQSYPAGYEDKTGYIQEDWHYRWIGKDLAKEYIESYYNYPGLFLKEKLLY